jgi:tryptophan synthase alpha chain
VCVGFGIKDGETARAVANISDGVVVGSALVQRIADLFKSKITETAIYVEEVSTIIKNIRSALDK